MVLTLISLLATGAAEPGVEFARDVQPILQRHCVECHGPKLQKGKLRLDSREAAMKSGILIPGKPQESELFQRVSRARGEEGVMPARGEPLKREEIARLRDWIAQGAKWPDVKTLHWAYQKPIRPQIRTPKIETRNPIDAFIVSRLEREGLTLSPEADRAVLLRRVSLDLTGLPPTLEEIEAARNDKPEGWYERAVDRLLASPAFGERWARPWLDLARYADSHGFQRDDLRELWAYRDWVIRALNADMPFDQFTIEQLAGDLLPGATEAQKIATGFHRCSPTNVEAGSDPEETRVNQIIDRVNTTAAVWLGSTLECAQCHDHKYDPFTQKDYYRFFAYFNGTAIEADRTNPKVPGSIRFIGPTMPLYNSGSGPEHARLTLSLKKLDAELEARRKELQGDLDRWENGLAEGMKKTAQTHVLPIADFDSSAGSPHKTLDDHSVLLVDDPPDKDTYTVTVRTTLRGITAFKLEALTHPSLPGNGPGRGDAKRPNFVLNTFAVTAAPQDREKETKPLRFNGATASFSQKNLEVAGAIDDNPRSAWAINPRFHESHWAIFTLAQPVDHEKGSTLTFRLVQEFGSGRTIGRLRLSALTGDPKARSIPADVVAILQTPRANWSAAQVARLLDHRVSEDATAMRLREERTTIERDMQAQKPSTTLVMQEMPRSRMTTIFQRGDFRTPSDQVQPGTPSFLHRAPEGPVSRLTLARWLVDRENPLVARVAVNRMWAEVFGRGLVSTVEDFGIKGERPTHPELLDWLAVEFMDSWSMKQVLRLIVTSATYRQLSRMTPDLLARDDQNQLLARGPRFRMDAEMIRDNALAVSGLLSLKPFGPPIRPFQPDGLWNKVGGDRVEYIVSPGEDRHRRGVYVVWKRASPYPSFVNFDATARLACTVKRSRSNTPLQALTLLNDPVYVEAAKALARRVVSERPRASVEERITHAFRLCLARSPSEREVRILQALYQQQSQSYRGRLQAARELLGSFTLPEGVSPAEFAAWYSVAAALLNLDETITKG